MPIYEYKCGNCELVNEYILKSEESPTKDCLGCGADPSSLERIISVHNVGKSSTAGDREFSDKNSFSIGIDYGCKVHELRVEGSYDPKSGKGIIGIRPAIKKERLT